MASNNTLTAIQITAIQMRRSLFKYHNVGDVDEHDDNSTSKAACVRELGGGVVWPLIVS